MPLLQSIPELIEKLDSYSPHQDIHSYTFFTAGITKKEALKIQLTSLLQQTKMSVIERFQLSFCLFNLQKKGFYNDFIKQLVALELSTLTSDEETFHLLVNSLPDEKIKKWFRPFLNEERLNADNKVAITSFIAYISFEQQNEIVEKLLEKHDVKPSYILTILSKLHNKGALQNFQQFPLIVKFLLSQLANKEINCDHAMDIMSDTVHLLDNDTILLFSNYCHELAHSDNPTLRDKSFTAINQMVMLSDNTLVELQVNFLCKLLCTAKACIKVAALKCLNKTIPYLENDQLTSVLEDYIVQELKPGNNASIYEQIIRILQTGLQSISQPKNWYDNFVLLYILPYTLVEDIELKACAISILAITIPYLRSQIISTVYSQLLRSISSPPFVYNSFYAICQLISRLPKQKQIEEKQLIALIHRFTNITNLGPITLKKCMAYCKELFHLLSPTRQKEFMMDLIQHLQKQESLELNILLYTALLSSPRSESPEHDLNTIHYIDAERIITLSEFIFKNQPINLNAAIAFLYLLIKISRWQVISLQEAYNFLQYFLTNESYLLQQACINTAANLFFIFIESDRFLLSNIWISRIDNECPLSCDAALQATFDTFFHLPQITQELIVKKVISIINHEEKDIRLKSINLLLESATLFPELIIPTLCAHLQVIYATSPKFLRKTHRIIAENISFLNEDNLDEIEKNLYISNPSINLIALDILIYFLINSNHSFELAKQKKETSASLIFSSLCLVLNRNKNANHDLNIIQDSLTLNNSEDYINYQRNFGT